MKAGEAFTRETVRRLARYRGLSGVRPAIRLDGNENPLGPSPRVLEELQALTPDVLARYPSPAALRARWAALLGVPTGGVLLTAGSGPGLALVAELTLGPMDLCVLAAPSFELYAWAALRRDARVLPIPCPRGFEFPAAGFRRALGHRDLGPRLVIIGNPDNPTGTSPPRGFVPESARRNPATLFLIDEAYAEFTGTSLIPLTRRLPNVIVARTLSKAYGLAGERVGCLVGDPGVIELLGRINIPYPITGPGAILAVAALEDQDHVRMSVQVARRGVARLVRGLKSLGIPHRSTRANFVLFRCRDDRQAAGVTGALAKRGIAVRDRSHLPQMSGWVRVSAGTQEEMVRFLYELERLWKRPARRRRLTKGMS